MKRLAVLDGLRGIAILQVFTFHIAETVGMAPSLAVPLVGTGYTGVELFFFISGFVIAWPFIKAKHEQAAPPTWRHFYTRRFLKIVPSYVLVIAIMYATGYAKHWTNTSPPIDLSSHLTFMHDWSRLTHDSIDGPLWTLGAEVNFYMVFPLVWWAFSRSPWLTLGASLAGSYAWKMWCFAHFSHKVGQCLSASMLGFIDLFVIGMFVAYLSLRIKLPRVWAEALAVEAIFMWAVVLLCLWVQTHDAGTFDQNQWMTSHQWLLGLSYGVLTLACLTGSRTIAGILAFPVLMWFGYISYNLYLWHHFIIIYAWHLGILSPLVVAFIVPLAYIITRYFEQPILREARVGR